MRMVSMSKMSAALWAGLLAITVNTIVLRLNEPLGFTPKKGGLLKLLVYHLGPAFESLGITSWWKSTGLPAPPAVSFWLVFHYVTGMVMVVLYVAFLERRLPGRGLIKGSLFSLLPWLVDGFVVMPLLGMGALGLSRFPLSTLVYFFIANWSFGAALGVFYESFVSNRPQGADAG